MEIFVSRKHFLVIFLVHYFISGSLQGDHHNQHPVPYALSPVYLQYLTNLEEQFYQVLKRDADNLSPASRHIIQRYLEEVETSIHPPNYDHHDDDKLQAAAHPILALQMINRFVKHFTNGQLVSASRNVAGSLIDKGALPSEKDIEDALEAVMRLQYIYDLDAHQLANGILDGVQTHAKLSARECFELGKFAQDSAYFTLALQWFEVTLQKLKSNSPGSECVSGLKEHVILKAMRDTIDEHNADYDESMEEGDMYSFNTRIYNTNYSAVAHLSLRKHLVDELKGKVLPEKDPRYYQAVEASMIALCHGQNLQSERVKAKLKCWFDFTRHPYWSINPLKIELLNSNPPIVQMHDVFNDRWIRYLKNLSYANLERAPQSPEATPRSAAYAWFEDSEIPLAPISKTVEFITGLNVAGTEAAEALQVAAYAFGGHVEPHFDSRGPDDPEPNPRGDRVTTFLVYLNDVESGGLTAFPLLGFFVRPVKNSAVLWYTNLKNGEVDGNTLHAACPVISGQKWIATKWTHIKENILKRPCGLNENE